MKQRTLMHNQAVVVMKSLLQVHEEEDNVDMVDFDRDELHFVDDSNVRIGNVDIIMLTIATSNNRI